MHGAARLAIGSAAGASVAAIVVSFGEPLFTVPTGGVGYLTVAAYPKGWDYAVIALLVGGAFLGGVIASWTVREAPVMAPPAHLSRSVVWSTAAVMFVLMLFVHDHPYSLMDPFHEGEHLTPAFLLKSGERPYKDVFF